MSLHNNQNFAEIIGKKAFLALHEYIQRENCKGYEFDDFLASKLMMFVTFRHLLFQRIFIQVGKRFPLNIRPLIGVPKLESSKARGFFATAYLKMYLYEGESIWLDFAKENLEWLMENHSIGFEGISWGNAFDFASRGGVFPKGLPTVVWTAHIAKAFDLAYHITKKPIYRQIVGKAACFVYKSLDRYQDGNGICLAYAPGLMNLVHNSNFLAAATLLRGWKYSHESNYLEISKRSYEWSLSGMNEDGSWYYGVGPKYFWIDNFHTAYNIDCIIEAYELLGENIVPFAKIDKAWNYWIEHFFEPDGTPWYYHNSKYPLDVQCAAQAIETLIKLSKYYPDAINLAEKILLWTLRNMRKSNGSFSFQRGRFFRNSLESIHWGQSTMLSSIAAYLYCSKCADGVIS